MKKSNILLLITAALVIGFAASHWCFAQTSHLSKKESTTDNYIAFHQLESFVGYLQDTGQTNTLQRFNEFATASSVSRAPADLGIRIHVLNCLRHGRTNEAIEMLEMQMRSDIVGFASGYRELPASTRNKVGLTAFRVARDYCGKYAVSTRHSDTDDVLKNAFTLLDENSTH